MNSPLVIAENYIEIGKNKTKLAVFKMLVLGFIAGAFIALAGVGATVAAATVKNPSIAKLIGACVFPAGLAMVIIAGSELFTGNCLLVIPLLNHDIKFSGLFKNWFFVYIGNLIGGISVALLCCYSHTFSLFNNAVAESVVSAAVGKVNLSFSDALIKGILCNFLVCIAVWMAFAAKDVNGKIIGLFFPIMLFVLCGYEHSVANMYYIPAGIFTAKEYGISAEGLNFLTFITKNLIPVTIGNIIGGGSVGLIYWSVYLKEKNN